MLSGRRGGFDHDRALRERVESHAAFGGDLLAGAREGDALLAARGMTESVLALQELQAAREMLREQLQQTGPRQDPQGYDLSFDHRANGAQYRTMAELTDGLRDNTLLREFIQEQLAHAGSLPDDGSRGHAGPGCPGTIYVRRCGRPRRRMDPGARMSPGTTTRMQSGRPWTT